VTSSRILPSLLAVLAIGVAVPILLVPVPMLLDYPNHLARIWLLGGGIGVWPFPQVYRLDWDALTNIGIDLLAVPLSAVLPWTAVGQVFLYLGSVLPVAGAVALNRTLFGGLSWWQIGFGVVAWNLTILAGFLNFNIGIGLALLAAAMDPWVGRRSTTATFLLRLALAFSLAVAHAFALFFYAALLCGMALGPAFGELLRWRTLRARVLPVLRSAAPPVVALIVLLLLAPALPGAHEAQTGGDTGWHRMVQKTAVLLLEKPGRKLRTGLALFQTYRLRLDMVALAVLVVPAVFALLRHRLRAHAGLLCVSAALGVLFVLVPDFAAGTGWIDIRFAEMAALTIMLAIRPELPPRWAPALAMLMLAVCIARTGFVTWVWEQRERDVRAVARALAPVPAGAAVLPVEITAVPTAAPLGRYFIDGFPAYQHLATLAVPWRHAFVPTVFAARGKQPLSLRPPWSEIGVPEGMIPNVHALTDPGMANGWFLEVAPYVLRWRDRFDYVLMLNADMQDQYGPVVLPPELEPVADEGFARLYRIRKQ
jgi:hypothetical protein